MSTLARPKCNQEITVTSCCEKMGLGKEKIIMAKKTKNTLTLVGEPKPHFIKGVLVAALGILIALGVPASGDTTVVGTGDPAIDLPAAQAAVDGGGTVTLKNGGANGEIAFNFGTVGLTIGNGVTIQGQDVAGNMARIEASGGQAVYIDVGGSDDVTIKNCHVVGTGQNGISGSSMMTTGTVRLENNVIEGGYAIWFGPFMGTPQLVTNYEIYNNTIRATNFSIAVVDAKSVRIENNETESPYGIFALNIGSNNGMIIKNNSVNASGGYYYGFGDLTLTIGMRVAHFPGFSGGEISGNTISVAPVSVGAPILSVGMYYGYDTPANGVLTAHNTIRGQADYTINVVDGSSDNVFMWNDLSGITAKKMDIFSSNQIAVFPGCDRNLFTRNTIGPLGDGATAGIKCEGSSNDFIRNDYTQSGIPGLTAGDIPCVWLANSYDPDTGDLVAEPENNLVFEPDGFPLETTVTDQVLDDPRELTGTTTNIVVGH